MIRLKISNPDLSVEERTVLTADYSTGTALTVRNSDNFTANWYAVVGEPGQERTEDARISSLGSSTNITIPSSLSFSHPKSTNIYESHYNQISVERKPVSGSYAEIAEGKIDIDWDNADLKTLITVAAGTSTDTYKWRFFNSTTGEYTAYSDELAGTGISRSTLGYVITQVKKSPLAIKVDEESMIDYADDFQQLIYEQLPKAWWFVKEGTAVATAASTYKYSVSANWSDLLSMKFMLYKYVTGSISDIYPLTYSPLNEFYNMKADQNQSNDDHAKFWTLLPPDGTSAKGYIGLHPTPSTTACQLRPVYQFELTALDSFADELVIPSPKGYIDYILYRICDDIKNDTANANKFNSRVSASILGLRRRARRQLGQPELFRFRGQRGWSKMYGEATYKGWDLNREYYF